MQGIAQEKQCIEFNPIYTGSFWEKIQKPKKCEKNVKFTPFGAVSRTPRGYLGHKFSMPGCAIVIRRYMPNFIEILQAVLRNLKCSKRSASEKNELIAAIVPRNKFRVLKTNEIWKISENLVNFVNFEAMFFSTQVYLGRKFSTIRSVASCKTTGWNFHPILRIVFDKKANKSKNRRKWFKKSNFLRETTGVNLVPNSKYCPGEALYRV